MSMIKLYFIARFVFVVALIGAAIVGGGYLVNKFFDMMGRIAEEEQ